MTVTYDNIQTQVQSVFYTLISNAITTANVVDGVPKALLTGTGFPYIIIRTPQPADTKIVLPPDFLDVNISMDIEIWSEQESVVRSLSDSVRATVRDGITTLQNEGVYNPRILSSSINPFQISERKIAHHQVLTVICRFGG